MVLLTRTCRKVIVSMRIEYKISNVFRCRKFQEIRIFRSNCDFVFHYKYRMDSVYFA